MDNNIQELIFRSLITILFALLTGVIIPLIRSKIEADNWDRIKSYAELGVRTAEQIFTDSADKHAYVIQYISDKSKEVGLTLSEQDIVNLLEYTVNLVKYGQEYTRDQK